MVADLGASDPGLDGFSSGTSAHLRVCKKYWRAQLFIWSRDWGPHQRRMGIHCLRVEIPRVVANIRKDRSKALLVIFMGFAWTDWVDSLTNITLNKVVLLAGMSVYQDAKGQPSPAHRVPTEFHYVDGGLDKADATDFLCVNRAIAGSWWQCFALFPVDIV